MARFIAKDRLDRLFEVGIVLKGLDGILELIGGILLLAVSPASLNRTVTALTQHELSEDPHDLVANELQRLAHGLTVPATAFASVYLLAHGVVKIVLAGALLHNKLWAYPWTIAFLVAFIAYQVYRILLSPTLGLVLLTLLDAAIAWLTWREYRRQHTSHRSRRDVLR